jgi:hypothetical protein
VEEIATVKELAVYKGSNILAIRIYVIVAVTVKITILWAVAHYGMSSRTEESGFGSW